jgi:hypothetical protein
MLTTKNVKSHAKPDDALGASLVLPGSHLKSRSKQAGPLTIAPEGFRTFVEGEE